MELRLKAVFERVKGGYLGYVEELPGANTQGKTLEEAKTNLREAIELVIQANRQLAEEEAAGRQLITEQIMDLIRHLERHGCELLREGANHTVYVNRAKRKVSAIPRHVEVFDPLCRRICRDLDVPRP